MHGEYAKLRITLPETPKPVRSDVFLGIHGRLYIMGVNKFLKQERRYI